MEAGREYRLRGQRVQNVQEGGVGIGPVEYRKTDDTKSGKRRRHGQWPDGNLDSAFVAILLLPGKSYG
jgi:hypothetical protein